MRQKVMFVSKFFFQLLRNIEERMSRVPNSDEISIVIVSTAQHQLCPNSRRWRKVMNQGHSKRVAINTKRNFQKFPNQDGSVCICTRASLAIQHGFEQKEGLLAFNDGPEVEVGHEDHCSEDS